LLGDHVAIARDGKFFDLNGGVRTEGRDGAFDGLQVEFAGFVGEQRAAGGKFGAFGDGDFRGGSGEGHAGASGKADDGGLGFGGDRVAGENEPGFGSGGEFDVGGGRCVGIGDGLCVGRGFVGENEGAFVAANGVFDEGFLAGDEAFADGDEGAVGIADIDGGVARDHRDVRLFLVGFDEDFFAADADGGVRGLVDHRRAAEETRRADDDAARGEGDEG